MDELPSNSARGSVLEGENVPKVKNKETEAVKTLHIPLCYPKYTDLWFNIHTMFFL